MNARAAFRVLLNSTIFFILFALTSFTAQTDAEQYYKSGMQKLNSKNYINAIGDFTTAISLNPKYAQAYVGRAKAKVGFAKQIGFSNNELCFDLIKALSLGEEGATHMIENSCMNECFNLKTAFYEPEIVFCADFSSKVLYDLPDNIGELNNLVRLNLFNNKMTSLSNKFSNLTNLLQLDLSSNRLTEVSPVIGKMTHLNDLNLNKNSLSSLPYELGGLQNIEFLYLRQNKLKEMPRSIAKLKNLKKLDLSLNQLETLPIEVSNLSKLETLILVGNDIRNKEQKKIEALLPNTKIYFE